ncbi:MAG: 3-dehydroquinate dehydratase [Bacteroidales bacterium]|nr:3-dehydroquinate dehydratase [Bacteroidales bacterium]MBR5651851.1 3-dehydroquinate dehydratase [Bacteroidales bacterium]MBR5720714.1 3-dehydroquinate dehydratase [Bacteroidales bacterium]
MKILIINGPNLNLTGQREVKIYGTTSFDDYIQILRKKYSDITIDYFQTNVEGEIINRLHVADENYDGIILNCGGYSHTSVAIADAIAAIKTTVIEVHISNVFGRELYRQNMITASKATGLISGLGLGSYETALLYLKDVATSGI